MYLLNASPLKGGPLWVFNCCGMPWVTKIRSSFGIIALADVDVAVSTLNRCRQLLASTVHCVVSGHKNILLNFAMVQLMWV